MEFITLICQFFILNCFCIGGNTENMVLDSLMDKNAIYNVPVQSCNLYLVKLCQCHRFMLQTNLLHLKTKFSTCFCTYYWFGFAQKTVTRAFITKAKTQPKTKLIMFLNRMMMII